MKIAQIQIGKNGFQENNYITIRNVLMNNDQVRIKVFKTSEKREEMQEIAEKIKGRLEEDLKKKIIIRKIGFVIIVNKLRKKA